MDSTSMRSSGLDELGVLSVLTGAADESAVEILPDAGGVVELDDLPGGAGAAGPAGGGVALGGADVGPGSALSAGAGEASVGGVAAVAPGRGTAPGAAGVSTLPRMIGRPSLPLPMTTIFEFGGLGERKRGLDAAPTQVRIRNPLADRLLEGGYAVGLDLFAF